MRRAFRRWPVHVSRVKRAARSVWHGRWSPAEIALALSLMWRVIDGLSRARSFALQASRPASEIRARSDEGKAGWRSTPPPESSPRNRRERQPPRALVQPHFHSLRLGADRRRASAADRDDAVHSRRGAGQGRDQLSARRRCSPTVTPEDRRITAQRHRGNGGAVRRRDGARRADIFSRQYLCIRLPADKLSGRPLASFSTSSWKCIFDRVRLLRL